MITPVKRVMTEKIVCVPVGTPLRDASDLMQEKRIRHLPVMDPDQNILGVLSQRDIQFQEHSQDLTVEMLMASPVEFINMDSSLREAILVMLGKRISSLLIIDSNDKVVGIVTTDDILWHLAHLLSFEKTSSQSSGFQIPNVQTIGEVAHQLSSTGI